MRRRRTILVEKSTDKLGMVYCPICTDARPRRREALAQHLTRPHQRCECGWVGLNVAKHILQNPDHQALAPVGGNVKTRRLTRIELGGE